MNHETMIIAKGLGLTFLVADTTSMETVDDSLLSDRPE